MSNRMPCFANSSLAKFLTKKPRSSTRGSSPISHTPSIFVFLKTIFRLITHGYHFKFRKRHNKFSAPLQKLLFAQLKFFYEMPRQNEEIIRLFCSRLLFGND